MDIGEADNLVSLLHHLRLSDPESLIDTHHRETGTPESIDVSVDGATGKIQFLADFINRVIDIAGKQLNQAQLANTRYGKYY